MIATKGIAAFVQPRYKNQIFAIVNPENPHEKILQYMGYEDSMFNHMLLI